MAAANIIKVRQCPNKVSSIAYYIYHSLWDGAADLNKRWWETDDYIKLITDHNERIEITDAIRMLHVIESRDDYDDYIDDIHQHNNLECS
jgi:hypothetical protein